MKKVLIVSLIVLIAAMTFVSCTDRPDPALLPEPVINFKAVKETMGTGIRVDLLNIEETLNDFSVGTDVHCIIADEEGNTLFSETYDNQYEIHSPISALVDDVTVGEVLTCTVTYEYRGVTTSATATDTVV